MSDQKRPKQSQAEQPGNESAMQPTPEIIRDSYRPANKLRDKVAVITGGDSGIGRAVAVHYAAEGADVVLVHLEEDDDAAETQREVEQRGRRCRILRGDVGDSDFCRQVVDDTLATFGRINILVNNAAEQYDWADITEIPEEQLLRTFRTNIFSHFHLCKAAVPHMGEGDVIIATSSVNAFKGNDTLIDYSATKGAIQGLVRSLAQSLAA
ncbi:short-chain dehydrogenase/reductase SDR [Salinisphaera dokdonensis CL-ES53]|uniref:Short-chain dehydrogenase/reductase SDR n=1 Tax=Salinisphaera dokdonensis CL-ES53 TaxID=1304272 RepID=A0ABV2AXB0_9GAMM